MPKKLTFHAVDYGEEIKFHIDFVNDLGEAEEFRMYRDPESNQWKIAAQILPNWIHENELTFSDIIEEEFS